MIVHYSEKGWEVVTQRAHGILAAEIGLQWKKNRRPMRWLETLLAIAEHDDAENELDGENLLTKSGGPLNYDMKSFDLSHCEKLQRMTVTKSRYIQLLTSMHMEFLYGKHCKTNKKARHFLNHQAKLRAALAGDLKLTNTELEKTYDFMEWCDAFSLLLCENQVQPEKRMTEISTGPDKKPYQVFTLRSKELCVDPWPFEPVVFSLRFETRVLSHLTFKSSAEFRKYFLKTPVEVINWTIRKKPTGFRFPEKLNR